MSTTIDKEFKDDTRIGEYAAKQPLSGTDIVTRMRLKGFSGSAAFIRIEETKKVS